MGMQAVSLLGSSYLITCVMVASPILKLVESSLKITVSQPRSSNFPGKSSIYHVVFPHITCHGRTEITKLLAHCC